MQPVPWQGTQDPGFDSLERADLCRLHGRGHLESRTEDTQRDEKSQGSLAEYRWQGNGGADGISQWENAIAGTMMKHRPHFGEKDGFRGLVEKD